MPLDAFDRIAVLEAIDQMSAILTEMREEVSGYVRRRRSSQPADARSPGSTGYRRGTPSLRPVKSDSDRNNVDSGREPYPVRSAARKLAVDG
jgi:hypothetical protein